MGKIGLYLIILSVVIAIMTMMNVVYAQQKPQQIYAVASYLQFSPGTPYCNPFSPSFIGDIGSWAPLAFYNVFNGQWWPVLADNWTIQVLPNGSGILTVHLRKGFYWYNGSTAIPFTAWDVYAEFYIGIKAFDWFYPFMQPQYADEEVRVLDNYTIQFLFYKWSPTEWILLLTTWIDVPYALWGPVVNELKSMSPSEALHYGSSNISTIAPPTCFTLAPWYLKSIGPNYIVRELDPPNILQPWYIVFPFPTFQYYDNEYVTKYFGSISGQMTAIISGEANWGIAGISAGQAQTYEAHGVDISTVIPSISIDGLTINPNVYPWNIPQVREAIAYVFNRSAISVGWPKVPNPYLSGVVPPIYTATFPKDVLSGLANYTYDPSKAAQMLESLGFYEKNGQWYTPNGTPLTLSIAAPGGWSDWVGPASVAAMELTAFGIPTKVIGIDVSTFFGYTLPGGSYTGAWFRLNSGTYIAIWSQINGWKSLVFAPFNFSKPWPFAWPIISNGQITGGVVHL